MEKFYTNIHNIGSKILVRTIEDGERIQFEEEFNPTLFIRTDQPTKFRTLDGVAVDSIKPGTIKDCHEFINTYKGTDFPVYGYREWTHQYISKEFEDCEWDIEKIRVCTLDIETESENGFPDTREANERVNVITLKDSLTNQIYSFGLGKHRVTKDNVKYLECETEKELLEKFHELFRVLKPDVVTGWNVKFFDMAYLIRRMENLFGKPFTRKLSPFGFMKEKNIKVHGREQLAYIVFGVATLDYMDLYKKYTYTQQEKYTLDHIAFTELGDRKLSYDGTMKDHYTNDFDNWVAYNIQDVELVDRLDDKLKLIELICQMSYDAGINYEEAFSQVRTWDALIFNHLRKRNIVIPPLNETIKSEKYPGGYVKDIPEKGISADWIVSFDLNSLYPHLIMQYNISPETLREDLPQFTTQSDHPVTEMLDGVLLPDLDKHDDIVMAASGYMFSGKVRGFLPELMEKMYDERVDAKDKMMESIKNNRTQDIAKFNTIQMARKIALNSAYGALGNQYFRYFDLRLCTSITLSGQLSIQWIERKINKYLNGLLDTEDKDYVVAVDTDAVYVTLGDLVSKLFDDDTESNVIIDFLDKACRDKIEPYIDECFEELADYMNAYQQKMIMKREVIAEKGVWTAKKRYVLNVWDNEGVRYEEPKIKIMGIEAVRSSTPATCREKILDSMSIIMNGTEDELMEYVSEFREEWKDLAVEDIAFPRSVNGLSKYFCPKDGYQKGTPIQVKGCLIYNRLLKRDKLVDYPIIRDGEKIRFTYLKEPNPVGDKVIGMLTELPIEFGLKKYIDYDLQFEKAYLDPLKSVLSVIGWNYEKQTSLEDFFV